MSDQRAPTWNECATYLPIAWNPWGPVAGSAKIVKASIRNLEDRKNGERRSGEPAEETNH